MSNIQAIKFSYQYYFFFNKNVNFFFFHYFILCILILKDMLNLLTIVLRKKKLSQEKKLILSIKNILVIEGRVKKEKNIEFNDFFNISEFVCAEQKEIYLNSPTRFSFFLKNNLILQKKFIFEKFYFSALDKIFSIYFMKIKILGNIFFIQYRIYGLGFKVKKSTFVQARSLRFDIGFGHGIYYKLPLQIKCLKRKRRFLLYSTDFHYLFFLKKHIDNLKLLNSYKIRGLKDLKHEVKMKKGKKQSKK